jgi:hypothetical protein
MGDIVASIDSVTVATVGDGTYDHVGTPVAAFNKGTIDETFTLTFTSGTAFDIEGFAIGAVGSGNISSGAAPVNPDTGVEYFEIFAGGFSGTFATGDTIEIVTVASAYPIWLKHVVPAGAAAISSNTSTFVIDGQSA